MDIAQDLLAVANYDVKIYDPHVAQEQVKFALSTLEESIEGAHLVVVLTDHNEFKQMDAAVLKGAMKTAVVFDTKNCVAEMDGVLTYRIGDLANIRAIQE
jgi:UDP-N-acetyl-D-mannosaminuronic acid dehydrogenase